MADEDLSRSGKAAAGLLAKAVACFVAGYVAAYVVGTPQQRMVNDVAEIKITLARVIERLGMTPESQLPVRTSGAGR